MFDVSHLLECQLKLRAEVDVELLAYVNARGHGLVAASQPHPS